MPVSLSRRRFIQITGLSGLACAMPSIAFAGITTEKYHWQGFAMGTDASIQLYHNDKHHATQLTRQCLQEILRLEKLFSLYEPSSTLNQLNREGRLEDAPEEFVELLQTAKDYGDLTQGIFDITVQPLWELYRHDPEPNDQQIQDALHRVDYRQVDITGQQVQFMQPGMAITLNGIAQGYITDKVTTLLKANGIENVLINMGEMHACGHHPDGTAWKIGIADPDNPDSNIKNITLMDKALATSGGYGTSLGNYHHLFDPTTGKNTHYHKSVSVIASSATQADALSTALYSMPPAQAQTILESLPEINAVFL